MTGTTEARGHEHTADGSSGSSHATGVPAWQVDPSFVPIRDGAVAHVEIDGEFVIWQFEFGAISRLDGPAAVVWVWIDDRSTIGEIAAGIAEAVSAPYDVLVDQVLDLVRVLGRSGIITGIARANTPEDTAPPTVDVPEGEPEA